MTKANTQVIAKAAAVLAGLGLVLSSFAMAFPAGAQTTTTTTTTTSSAMFTRDLTIGSTGADVTALQTWLIGKGFAIPAGATGYFGTQTQAAVAAYQAANGITPAAGYFGPITRAKVNAGGSVVVPGDDDDDDDGTSSDGTLSGGEADLRNFDLVAEDGEGSEGEEEVLAATAEFDVRGGDVRVERAELTLHATDTGTPSEKPWDYIENVSVWNGSEKLGDVDSGSRDDWDEEDTDDDVFSGGSDDMYTISIEDLDVVIDEDDMAELTFAFDISDGIDSDDLDQEFELAVQDEGIRAVDAEGIDQFTGDDGETTDFGFTEEENGDLSIRSSDDDPDATTFKVEDDQTSDEYEVFVFEIRNSDEADTMITDLTITASSSISSNVASTTDVIRRATLSDGDDEYRADITDGVVDTKVHGTLDFEDIESQIDGDETKTYTLMVEFSSDSSYASGLPATISFAVASSSVDAEGVDSGDEVESGDISGSADSEDHSLAEVGFDVSPVSTSNDRDSDEDFATYVIKFEVTADEDDPIFINDTAASSTATTGAVYNILGSTAFVGTQTATLVSNASMESGVYRIDAGDTEEFTLTVTLNPGTAGQYRIELDQVNYSVDSDLTPLSTFNVDNDNADFETDNEFIPDA